MRPPPGVPSLPPEQRRRLAIAIPTTLAVPIGIALVAVALGLDLLIGPILAGGLGWLVALVLRVPVGAVAVRLLGDEQRARPWLVASSGPLEELARLVVVLALGRDVDTAISIAIGWSAIEAIYAIVNGTLVVLLLSRGDPEADQVRALLPFPDAILSSSAWWGPFERIWASALHVAFTLFIAAYPPAVAVTIPLHSATNLAILAQRRSFAAIQTAGAIWAGALLAVAVAVTRSTPT